MKLNSCFTILTLFFTFPSIAQTQECYRYIDSIPIGYSVEVLMHEKKFYYREWKGLKLSVSSGVVHDNFFVSTAQSYQKRITDVKSVKGNSNICRLRIEIHRLNTPFFIHNIELNKLKGKVLKIENIELLSGVSCDIPITRASEDNIEIIDITINKRRDCIYDLEGVKINTSRNDSVTVSMLYPNENNYIIFNEKNNKVIHKVDKLMLNLNGINYNLQLAQCSDDIMKAWESGALPRESDD